MQCPASDIALTRAEWQQVLFSERPSRRGLLRLKPSWPCSPLRLRVHRNHPFEYVASVLSPFLAFARLDATVVLSDYDDALTWADVTVRADDQPFDVELVWLDFCRYRGRSSPEELASWLLERVSALRASTDAPILVADDAEGDAVAARFNEELFEARERSLGFASARRVESKELGERYHDARMERMLAPGCPRSRTWNPHDGWAPSGSPVWLRPGRSRGARPRPHLVVRCARRGWHRWRRGPYRSCRDPPQGGRLRRRRTLVGLASKNEDSDVRDVFARRATEFPLTLDRVAARAVSWESKASGLRRIADELRIGLDSILFVDDNPGELAAVASGCPGVWTLRAGPGPEDTLRALEHHPGLLRWQADATDRLRASDLAADVARRAGSEGVEDPMTYLASLEVRLEVRST